MAGRDTGYLPPPPFNPERGEIMLSVSKSTHCNPFLYVRKQLEGDNSYSHLINLYRSIESEIAKGNDPMGWRLIRSELDGVLGIMEEINLLGVE